MGGVDGVAPPLRVRSEVAQHVRERPVYLGRRPEDMGVIAIREDRALAPHEAVHPDGDAARQRLHAARERRAVVRLDEEMQVVSLDGEVHDPDVRPAGDTAQRHRDDGVAPARSQVPDVIAGAEGHVDGRPAVDLDPPPVRDGGLVPGRLRASADALPSPAEPGKEVEWELGAAWRHPYGVPSSVLAGSLSAT